MSSKKNLIIAIFLLIMMVTVNAVYCQDDSTREILKQGLLGAGTHELNFDAQNYSSGVYFYQLTVLDERLTVVYKETKKMILVK